MSSVVAAFRIDNHKVGELFFLANNLIRSPPHFGIEIFKITGGSIASRFHLRTHREFRGLATFLGYNPVAFYSDRMFSSRRPISQALA